MRLAKDDLYVTGMLLAAIGTLAAPVLSALAVFELGKAWSFGDGFSKALPMALAAVTMNLALFILVWYLGSADRARRRSDAESGVGSGVRASRRRQAEKAQRQGKPRNTFQPLGRVRRRWTLIWVFMVVQVGVATIAALYAFPESPIGAESAALRFFGLMVLYAVASLVVERIVYRRLTRLVGRHGRVAEQVRAIAATRDWLYDDDEAKVEGRWTAPPFDRIRGLVALPMATSTQAGRPMGVAWMEGDFGPEALPFRSFASRAVWAELPRPLQAVDFVPERISDAVFKLLGGRDVDVESYDFNRRWRVKATDEREAHGILQPRMIDFLNSVEDPAVAFHVDGERVLIWDDGKDEDVDLDARVSLLEHFLERLPGHLSNPARDSSTDTDTSDRRAT